MPCLLLYLSISMTPPCLNLYFQFLDYFPHILVLDFFPLQVHSPHNWILAKHCPSVHYAILNVLHAECKRHGYFLPGLLLLCITCRVTWRITCRVTFRFTCCHLCHVFFIRCLVRGCPTFVILPAFSISLISSSVFRTDLILLLVLE